MAFTEKDLEKKNLAEISALALGYEQKIKDLANNIKSGIAKPVDMLTLNSELALVRKVRDKKMAEHENSIHKGHHPKATKPLKSYDDYLRNKKK
jgi:hypothetical protein